VKTLTLRIDETLDRWLDEEAQRLGRTKSDVVRDALVLRQNGKKQASVHALMRGVCGSLKGAPRDVSSNVRKYLKGLGQ
jgi:predicted transcriptional regulator